VGIDERIAIFAIRDILNGEELTIDYRFQSFGEVDERCMCGAKNCKDRRRNGPASVVATAPKKRVRRRTESSDDLVIR
jgi:hypothetical protein